MLQPALAGIRKFSRAVVLTSGDRHESQPAPAKASVEPLQLPWLSAGDGPAADSNGYADTIRRFWRVVPISQVPQVAFVHGII